MSSNAAHHESGHAIVALSLGVQIRALVLGFRDGWVSFPPGTRRVAGLERIITAAGPAAECQFMGRRCPFDLTLEPQWESDAHQLTSLVTIEFDGEDQVAAYRAAILNAEIMVADLHREIASVSEAAARYRYLTEADIRTIVDIPLYDDRRLIADPAQRWAEQTKESELRARRARLEARHAEREQCSTAHRFSLALLGRARTLELAP